MLFENSHVRLQAEDQIATLCLDFPDSPGNLLTPAALDSLDAALTALEAKPTCDVLLIRSAQPGFAAGYDARALEAMQTAEEWEAFAAHGQRVMDRLARFGEIMPTVALIDGPCLDAGLELALACDYRLALARPTTRLGMPMISHGLTPCWGGSQRLPRLIGLRAGLRLLMNGETISAREAATLQLVDHVFCERRARIEVRTFLGQLQDRPQRRSQPRNWWHRLRDRFPFGQQRLFRSASANIATIPSSERPAPAALLEMVKRGHECLTEGLALERRSFARLAMHETTRHGLRLRIALEQPAKIHPEPINPIPMLPDTIGIVGGSERAASLARWLALNGRRVILQESNERLLNECGRQIERLFEDAIRLGWCTPLEAQQAQSSIQRTMHWTGFDRVGWVIEASTGDFAAQRELIDELEDRCRPRVPMVVTSHHLSIDSLTADMVRAGRVAGLRFPTPFDRNGLVEIVRGPQTDSTTVATLEKWLRQLGRQPIIITDRPGGIVARVLFAYLSEAVQLVSEGLPPEEIDQAMRAFGMVEGPLEMLDRIGIHRVADVVQGLQESLGERYMRNLLLEPMRAIGWTGVEAGEGFYRYSARGKTPNEIARMLLWREADEDILAHYIFDPEQAIREGVERMVLRTINEAAAGLGEEHPCTINVAAIIGMGWAPHRGGPLRYADECGLAALVDQLRQFSERLGSRFRPNGELVRRAEAGESFHGTPAPERVNDTTSRRVAS